MSILKVANIHFEAAGTKRIDYLNDDVLRISFGETVLSGNARFNGNGATKLSVGTTAQRPTGESGLIRYNTQIGSFEGHNGTAWANIVSGIIDLSAANGWANTVASASAVAANTLSETRTNAANGWANTVGGAAFAQANTARDHANAAFEKANTVGGNYVLTAFNAPGTWTKPATVKAIKVTVVGGGGSGGPGSPSSAGTGGGGGGAAIEYIPAPSVPGPVAVTVGAAGGTSSFGAFCSATGGANPTGGLGSGGNLNIRGGAGGILSGGPTILGGGGGAYGGGGPGGAPGFPGGSGSTGSSGVVVIEEFY